MPIISPNEYLGYVPRQPGLDFSPLAGVLSQIAQQRRQQQIDENQLAQQDLENQVSLRQLQEQENQAVQPGERPTVETQAPLPVRSGGDLSALTGATVDEAAGPPAAPETTSVGTMTVHAPQPMQYKTLPAIIDRRTGRQALPELKMPIKYESDALEAAKKAAAAAGKTPAGTKAAKEKPTIVFPQDANLPAALSGKRFDEGDDLYPYAEGVMKAYASGTFKPEGRGTQLQHVTRKLDDGTEQSGVFNPSGSETVGGLPPGGFRWGSGGGAGGGGTRMPVAAGAHGEDFLASIPDAGRQELIKAIAEGRKQFPSGRLTPQSEKLMEDVLRYRPDLNEAQIKGMYGAYVDLTKGGAGSSRQAVVSANRLVAHAKSLQEASKDLGWMGGAPFSSVNWAAQKIAPSAMSTARTKYQLEGAAIGSEFGRLVKGGVPTKEDTEALKALRDPTLAPAAREAALGAVLELAEGQANAQEQWYRQSFGRGSVESGHPLFGKGWRWDPQDGWKADIASAPNKPDQADKPEATQKKPTPAATPTVAAPKAQGFQVPSQFSAGTAGVVRPAFGQQPMVQPTRRRIAGPIVRVVTEQ